ncbi:sensor histidine kinase [Acetonema longum]|uniref:histidine kinase n=1 Tax=Acetonema longum DSM 6540 TaxID=1009370 RepID=F7NGN5_9FIRM|nr:HAMP domain-containing sensor histidine kinase [Acetonema longum]EGO64839.1 histidine kinase [Acetonema longum DSM 6540]
MFRHERRPCSYFGHGKESRHQVPERFRLMHDHLHQHHRSQFLRHYRYFRYFRPVALVFNLLILYLLFSWGGFKGIGIFFAALIIMKEVLQFFFLVRLEKRIFKPMESIRQGLDEVARGNYSVKAAYDKPNDLSFLIASFNEMTEKLSESEKMQAEYEENRKALIANISHDLKTPLTAIHGYIETLLEVPAASGENRDKYLKIIYKNIIYVNRLIDDLVLFSKLDMQKLEFHYEAVSIRPFMNDLMEEYRFDCEEKNIGFHYRVELDEDVWLNVDGKRVHQAFRNIISNAVQHGPETGLSIEVRLCRQGDFVCIDIKDNGPGIPEDKLPFIFDRFYRIETERPKSFAGTGLGLAIARELLESQGGKLTVSSIINEGACFSIMLPILRDSGGEASETYPDY